VRGGMLVNDTLWYATGDAAWATVRDNFAFAGSANPTIFPGALQPGPFLPTAASFSRTKLGWTVGVGAETKLSGNWSAKLEYLYVDLGNVTEAFPIAINPASGPGFNTGGTATATRTSHVTDNIVRIGLNYKLF
jgi:outer membrane immunogenic protein